MVAPTQALTMIDAGAVAHAKIDAIPVIVKASGYPVAPVSAQRVVVKTAGTYPVAPVEPQEIVFVTPGPLVPETKTTPIPVVIV